GLQRHRRGKRSATGQIDSIETTCSTLTTARDSVRRALSLISAGRHDEARRLLVQAEQQQPDGETRAEVVAATAWVMGETGDLAGGFELCRAAVRADESGDSPVGPIGRAILLGRLGALEVRAGNDDAALPLFGTAADALHNHPGARGRVLINRGYLHLRRRELSAAAADLDGAMDSFSCIGDVVEQAKVAHNRGYIDLLAGDLAGALDRMNTARETLRHLSSAHRAICDLDRAEVLEAAGMVGEAVHTLEQVLELVDGSTDWHTRAEAELLLARILADNDEVRAATLAEAAALHFREHGSDGSAVRADAVAARILLRSSAAGGSTISTDELVDRLDARHLTAHSTELKLHVALSLLDSDIAEAEKHTARIDVHRDAPVSTRLLAARVRSALERKRGRPTDALVHAAQAMDEFVEWQTHFGNLGMQVATQRVATDVVLQGLNAAWETKDPERIFEWSERARGAAAAWNPVRAPRDNDIVRALAEIRSLRDSDDAAAHRRRVELREQVRDLGWRGSSSSATLPSQPGVADAARALNSADATLITYSWLGDRLIAMTLSADTIATFDLGPWCAIVQELSGLPADLDAAAARRGSRLRTSIEHSLTRRLATLDRLLIAPVLGESMHHRILLTVPGVLGGIPWGLLPNIASRSLSVAVSVQWWIGSSGGSRGGEPVGVVSGPGTEYGEQEAQDVARAWEGHSRIVTGRAATTDAAATLAEASSTLHVSAHGGYSREHPLFSSIALDDGPWFGHDIVQLTSVPALVVVSACQMGRAAGEFDALGMARAWLHAGARCVVAAPANIDDKRAAEFFPALHREIAAGETPGDALATVRGQASESADLGVAALCYGNAW
ncbi:MAG: CHAT domain-containing protein, partial [Rhodococcus sp. (in: high G+C Gram-positive bacteria)]